MKTESIDIKKLYRKEVAKLPKMTDEKEKELRLF